MPLMTEQFMKDSTDKIARIVDEFTIIIGRTTDLDLITGVTMQCVANRLEDLSVNSDDYDIENSFNVPFRQVAGNIVANALFAAAFPDAVTAFEFHCQNFGSELDESVVSLASLLDYWNVTNDHPNYAHVLDPNFQDIWMYFNPDDPLPIESIYPRMIHPDWRGGFYPNAEAMYSYNLVGPVLTDGYEVGEFYGAAQLVVEVTVDFAGGSAPPTITVTGTDDAGVSQTFTATVTGGNNPTSAVATTITPAIVGMTRQSFAVASVTGIVDGSVLTVNAGEPDEEVITIENVSGLNLLAVFLKDHDAGATLTGKRTFLCPCTSSVGYVARCRDVTLVAVGITGHTAGAVRVIGTAERIAV